MRNAVAATGAMLSKSSLPPPRPFECGHRKSDDQSRGATRPPIAPSAPYVRSGGPSRPCPPQDLPALHSPFSRRGDGHCSHDHQAKDATPRLPCFGVAMATLIPNFHMPPTHAPANIEMIPMLSVPAHLLKARPCHD